MKTILIFFVCLFFMSFQAFYGKDFKCLNIICHNGNEILVNVNALQAHLNHGDCVGSCYSNYKKAHFNSDLNKKDININENKKLISVYPNPTKDLVNIEIDLKNIENKTIKVEIVDLQGKQIYENIYTKNKPTIEIDLSNFFNGIYILNTNVNNQNFKTKLIIQH